MIFHVGRQGMTEGIVSINPLDWTIEDRYGTLPEGVTNPFRCTGLEIDGVNGIFIRSGQW